MNFYIARYIIIYDTQNYISYSNRKNITEFNMKKAFIMCATFAMMAAGLTGCGVFQKQEKVSVDQAGHVATATIPETQGVIDKVLYGEWVAMDINGQAVVGDERPYIIFENSLENPFIVNVYANNGCNILNGQMSVTPGGKMAPTSQLLSTMRMCPDAPYEMGFNLAVNNVKTYSLEKAGSDYILYMRNAEGTPLLTLRKSGIEFVNGAWTVARINDNTVPEEVEMQLVIDIPELKIHGNAGCNTLNGAIFIDPAKQNAIQFKNLATTRMTCPFIALEQSLLVALEEVETASHGSDSKTVLLKDQSGKTVIELIRLNLRNEE